MTGFEDWLLAKGLAVTKARATSYLKALLAKDFSERLVDRVRRYPSIALGWRERRRLRHLVSEQATWRDLLDPDRAAIVTLSTTLASRVLRGHDVANRANALAIALRAETPAALDLPELAQLLANRIRDVQNDVRDIKGVLEPRPHDEAIDAFVTLDEYFVPFLAHGNRFHHRARLIGRTEEFARLTANLMDVDGPRVVVLTGGAGAGKSRLILELLRHVSDVAPGQQIAVRVESRPLDADSFLRLPSEPRLLLVEDAHRDPDAVAQILHLVARRPNTRAVITTRGSADAVTAAAATAGLDTSKITTDNLARLGMTAARELVAELQGDDVPLTLGAVDYLAEAARSMPVVAVLAIEMTRAGELLTPLPLDKNIRTEVMARYGQIITSGIPNLDAQRAGDLLALMAAIGPVDLDSADTLDRMATFLSITRGELLEDLQRVIQDGPVLERRRHVQVVPDVLADQILAGEALKLGSDTGYVTRLIAAFASTHLERLVRKVAELDWRVNRLAVTEGTPASDLFGPLWVPVAADIQAGGNALRTHWLSALAGVAYTQPNRVLALVGDVLAAPQLGPDQESFTTYTHADVRRAAAPLVAACANSDPSLVPEALDVLWSLALEDHRPPNQDGNHPARLLEDIANLGTSNLQTIGALVDAVERWLANPDPINAPLTPVSVLRPLVAKAVMIYDPGHLAIRLHPRLVNVGVVSPLRDRLRILLEEISRHDSTRRRVEAVSVLCDALHEPAAYNGLRVTADDTTAWVDDDLATIATLSRIAANVTEPLLRIEMRSSIEWHAVRSISPNLRDQCNDLANRLDGHHGDLLSAVLLGGGPDLDRARRIRNRGQDALDANAQATPRPSAAPGGSTPADTSATPEAPNALVDPDFDADFDADYQLAEDLEKHDIQTAADELADLGPEEAVTLLSTRIMTLSQARPRHALYSGPFNVVTQLAARDPSQVPDYLNAIEADTTGALDPWVGPLLNVLASIDKDDFRATAGRLIGGRTALAAATAHGFANYGWTTTVPDAASLLADSTAHADPGIARAAIAASADLLLGDAETWIPRLRKAVDEYPREVSHVLESTYRKPLGADWTAKLTADQQLALADLTCALPRWNYGHHRLVAALADKQPAAILERLRDRPVDDRYHGIQGLPAALSKHPDTLARWLLDGAKLDQVEQWRRSEIWPLICGLPLTDGARSAVAQVLGSGTDAELAYLTRVLGRQDQFVIDEIDLVATVLNHLGSFPGITTEAREEHFGNLSLSIDGTGFGRAGAGPGMSMRERAEVARTTSLDEKRTPIVRDFYQRVADALQAQLERAQRQHDDDRD